MERRRVAVAPEQEFQSRLRLFRLLSELYPVDFESWSPNVTSSCDGVILWSASDEDMGIVAAHSLDCLVVAKPEEPLVSVKKGVVEFGEATLLDPYFRSQTMIEEGIEEFPALRRQDSDELVCSLESQPYWLARRVGRASVSIVALGPLEMPEKQTVYEHFNRRFWLRLLPIFQFLKQLTSRDGWDPPPLRACLMFDDPNLHWKTYGFIDFATLVRHAQEFKYHVTFAMVPLDAWFVYPAAAALLRENQANISLLMHGNDHTYVELGSSLDANGFAQLLAQALKRIDRFERRSGVHVARVMAPPYGAFQESVADPMMNLGYEAVCVSRSSLTSWNKGKTWAASFGHPMAEFIGGGLPVIPRHVMARGHEGGYRLAAFLNQPIIPHGHHQDCAEGLDLLAHAANTINSLGKVTWSDMTSISRSNYLTKRSDGTVVVKMLARRVTVPLDEGIKEIVVERPWISDGAGDESLICKEGERTCFNGRYGRQSPAIPLRCKGAVELICPPQCAVDHRTIKLPRLKPWTVARRLLSETRDRIEPLTATIRHKLASKN